MVYGTGVISVAGISFTFLETGQRSIELMMVSTSAPIYCSCMSLVDMQCYQQARPCQSHTTLPAAVHVQGRLASEMLCSQEVVLHYIHGTVT